MNSLVQQSTGLIGSQADITALESKDDARLLVFADSHGSFDVVKDMILRFGNEVDALVFCGDGFFDLLSYIEESLYDEKLKDCLPSVIIPVKGNGDSHEYIVKSSDSDEELQSIHGPYTLPSKISCEIAGRSIFVAHGDHYRVDMGTETILNAAHAIDADLVFFGHTHRTHWEETGGTLVLNPGSCYRSRSALPPSFALVSFPGEQDRFNIEYYEVGKSLFKNYKFSPLAVPTN